MRIAGTHFTLAYKHRSGVPASSTANFFRWQNTRPFFTARQFVFRMAPIADMQIFQMMLSGDI
jgi:hypothetical protein